MSGIGAQSGVAVELRPCFIFGFRGGRLFRIDAYLDRRPSPCGPKAPRLGLPAIVKAQSEDSVRALFAEHVFPPAAPLSSRGTPS
jgi:hypothetical protein